MRPSGLDVYDTRTGSSEHAHEIYTCAVEAPPVHSEHAVNEASPELLAA